MNAVPTGCQCNIHTPVDDELDLGARRSRGFADRKGELQELASVEILLPELDAIDACLDRLGDPFGQRRPAHLAVRHEAEQRGCGQQSARGQKSARPSSGLDAVAYNRRGILPDS